jgi:hypothetical protein
VTPEPRHLAWCKVAGKTQVQVFEACKAAALGDLWRIAHANGYGTKDPDLAAHIKVCAAGAGITTDDGTADITGYPRGGKPDGELQYIQVIGWSPTVKGETYQHVYYASGDPELIGFAADDEDSLIEKISLLYDSVGSEG